MSDRKTYIWIVNEAGHDYRNALELVPDAELRPLTQGNVNPLQVDRMAYNLARGIVKFSRPEDFILISGTPMVNAVAIHLWLLHYEEAKVLQWNAKRREYELSTLSKDHLRHLLDIEMNRG